MSVQLQGAGPTSPFTQFTWVSWLAVHAACLAVTIDTPSLHRQVSSPNWSRNDGKVGLKSKEDCLQLRELLSKAAQPGDDLDYLNSFLEQAEGFIIY